MKLEDWNPSVKALTVLISVFLISVRMEPVAPLLFMIWVVALTFLLGKVAVKPYLLLWCSVLLLAFGFTWSALLFPLTNPSARIVWEWRSLQVTDLAVHNGLSLGLRAMGFAAISLMFVFTTDATRFMLSLMQQCKLPPKLAYSILAGYRFLPLFSEELRILHDAHRIRGIGRARGMKAKLQQMQRYVIPLMASAIRKAERTAMAMESKGFTGRRDRTYYTRVPLQAKDWMLMLLTIAPLLAVRMLE